MDTRQSVWGIFFVIFFHLFFKKVPGSWWGFKSDLVPVMYKGGLRSGLKSPFVLLWRILRSEGRWDALSLLLWLCTKGYGRLQPWHSPEVALNPHVSKDFHLHNLVRQGKIFLFRCWLRHNVCTACFSFIGCPKWESARAAEMLKVRKYTHVPSTKVPSTGGVGEIS